tara:strand:+ start:4405 stop:4635 length:231 start_codon:yes stop_codon:yes gene_type:complete
VSNIVERLERLRSLRENLCEKSQTWSEAFETRDWIIEKIRDVIQQGKNDKVTKEDIINKLEDFICVIEPQSDEEEQ